MTNPELAASVPLARAVAATRWAELPPVAREQAAALFLDTLAVIAAGSSEASFRPWIDVLAREPGPCSALGVCTGVSAWNAMLANGGATTVLQWQDGHRLARGHPASHLVPALLALAEETDASSDALMSAFVGGYECGTRIGIALGGLQAPLHDGGTWPTIGTAAACARFLGGDEGTIAAALEGAAAVATLPWRATATQGATIHHLYVGLGVTTAVAAARAARAGITALPGTLEQFFGPRAGACFDATALTAGIGCDGHWSEFTLMSAYLKWHPVCAHFSGVAEALERLTGAPATGGRPALTRDSVREVEVALCRAALTYDAGTTTNELAARFSVPAIVHALLGPDALHGSALSRPALEDPATQAWLPRVRVVHDASLDPLYPAGRPTRVTVTLIDGSRRTESVLDVYGDSARPLSRVDRRAKAIRALSRRYGTAGAVAVTDAFESFIGGNAVAVLTRALRQPRPC